ncbi:ABC transporter substrate-binding protein [Tardisphaera miroshnichenkoae]
MRSLLRKIVASFGILLFMLSSIVAGGLVAPASGQELPAIITTNNASMIYTPTMPVWNPYAATNWITSGNTVVDNLPLMYFNPFEGTMLPAAATGYSEFPSNDSFIVYLRKGLYWYNGSTTIPFTAWDVYTQFYIGAKVFSWYAPYMNYSKIRVLNNYTIEFTLNSWAPTVPYLALSTELATPYSVWKGVLANVTAYPNATVATEHAAYVERFVAPIWSLGPYYVSKVSPPYVVLQLEPQSLLSTWDQVFPYHTWQDYSSTLEIWFTGGNGQTLNGMMAGQVTWGQVGLSASQIKLIEGKGWDAPSLPGYTAWGFAANPDVYPLNMSQVRIAIAYIINETEADASWNEYGIDLFNPTYYAIGTTQYANLPNWVRNDIRKIGVNWTEAADLLESVGFYKQNGQWYMPNGKPFTLSIQLPSGWTNVDTVAQNEASQLTEFGIPTQTFADNPSTLYGSMVPSGDFQLALYYAVPLMFASYATSWTMGDWWWMTGYNTVNDGGWDAHANYPITFPNGTKGYFNFTQWYADFQSEVPMSAAYNQTMLWAIAFQNSEMPSIPVESGVQMAEYYGQDYNVSWVFNLPLADEYTVYYPGIDPQPINVDNVLYWPILWGIAPAGIQSPFAEALASRSLSPAYAAFLGLPSSYSANYVNSVSTSALSNAKISLTVSPTTLTAGTSTTLTATVTYANGTPASGVAVDFLSSGAQVGTATTGSNGQAVFTYTPTSAGTQAITAKLALVSSVVSSAVTLNVTAKTTTTTTTTTLYGIVAAVVVIVVVVAVVLALSRRGGKKGPQATQRSRFGDH